MARGSEFLGARYAIMGGAMSWVSERNLVAAISNAGGFGVIACGAMNPELLDREITETKARTERPFGVNLITMHPQLHELIEVCARHGVGHIVLAGGLPPGWRHREIKGTGAKLIAFAPALSLAKKLMRSGADAIVIEGMEAGGHIGPVSTNVLAQEILPTICNDIPVFVAGGIGRARRSRRILRWRGGRAARHRSSARRRASRIRTSRRPSSGRARAMRCRACSSTLACGDSRCGHSKNKETERFAAKQREIAEHLDGKRLEMARRSCRSNIIGRGALRRAVVDGDIETGSVMAGQSVGMVTKEQPTAEIIAELMDQARRRSLGAEQLLRRGGGAGRRRSRRRRVRCGCL
jgi:enoyl-[acyl-carrier protein] reductase II